VEKVITLTFNTQRLDYLVQVLMQRPYSEVAPVISEIQKQVMEQQSAPPQINGHTEDKPTTVQ
jgi:hypothetical protein